ncbi:3,4-dehydroadipyl-CoA semialdehyde dehydrogenase [Denitromonas iodatirespirans]|uniref:3,4-dehydroadipyl-CoA semialdehyde dehydrogenase n=1 Tax=Denitromonas iodatirespirans TaxID=2795389 RepID=A0A944H9U3_DENI1|nr:3,4-dehydroadipyl-CoA semialdehyde dehydrogenase [Denitromonas iodatirespirans]MBT0963818.1 3,4-dehydroadipyl-CoA semialdehyde dehydrogenase [Denitromonas iodatirespirans]
MKLDNFVCGQWRAGQGEGVALVDPMDGETLVRVGTDGIDCAAALEHARSVGGTALRALTHAQRAQRLAAIAEVLGAHRDAYFDISLRNSGATPADAGFDVDGAIFTLKTYARLGRSLGDTRGLVDGAVVPLSKEGNFVARHFLTPQKGAAIFINAFNFPAWGLWEKAAPALLAGMPVVLKPATPTAWLAQRMVADVVAAGILPEGALSILCGSARDLLDHVNESDVVSFTGSADTARHIRSHARVLAGSVRVNIEADSVNAAVLGPDAVSASAEFELAVKEVVREMTIKAGQKCTAIRRVFVPEAQTAALEAALVERLGRITVGDPRQEGVRMGPLVNRAQQAAALAGIERLKAECVVVFGGDPDFAPEGVDPARAAFVQPTVLRCEHPARARVVHEVEVFGPVVTIVPYADEAALGRMLRLGQGSLVASVYSSDGVFVHALVDEVGDLHGRMMLVDATVGAAHTGHGNVMPTCLHGGPGRAGGGEELGGLRALGLYLRRHVVQGSPERLASLASACADAALLAA